MVKFGAEAMNSKIKPTRLRKHRVNHEKIELGSGNVFVDLVFRNAKERLLKAKLATKIAQLKEKKDGDYGRKP